MKLILLTLLFYVPQALCSSITGVVEVQGSNPKGTLYIFAKNYRSKMPMPVAVKKIVNPKFPVSFELSKKDAMIKTMPFTGPFKIIAKISPSGDPMDKTGKKDSTTKPISIGTKGIKLLLK
jgi:hypothetical protein